MLEICNIPNQSEFYAYWHHENVFPFPGWYKKQTLVCHNSAETEIMSVDAGLRTDDIRSIATGFVFSETFPHSDGYGKPQRDQVASVSHLSHSIDRMSLDVVDHVPSNIPESSFLAKQNDFDENEAVSRTILKKNRSPIMRLVSRTHRVDLAWLFERINLDMSIPIRHVRTTQTIGRHFGQECFHDHSKEVSDAVVRN